jgi:signal transduction histidine kinase
MWLEVVAFFLVVVATTFSWFFYRNQKILDKRITAFESELAYARAMLTRRGALANEVAHEIKNPLTAIVCSVDAILHLLHEEIDAKHMLMLSSIKDYSETILQVVSDFIDISRVDAGEIVATPKSTYIQPIIQTVTELLRGLAMRKRVTLSVKMSSESCCALVDTKHLKQILFNIIHNAVKFSFEGGNVEVQICQKEISDEYASKVLTIIVKDNGKGIEPKELVDIFDPYRKKSSVGDQGLGLGLPLSRSLIELSGGSIRIESNLGSGTTVTLELVAAADSGNIKPDKSSVSEKSVLPLEGQRILLVEEDPSLREAVENLIGIWGGLSFGVADAAVAVSLLTREAFDSVVVATESIAKDDSLLEIASSLGTSMVLTRKDIESQSLRFTHASDFPFTVLDKPFSGDTLLSLLIKRT